MIFVLKKMKKALVFQGLFQNILYRVFIGKEAITQILSDRLLHLLYRVFIGKEVIIYGFQKTYHFELYQIIFWPNLIFLKSFSAF